MGRQLSQSPFTKDFHRAHIYGSSPSYSDFHSRAFLRSISFRRKPAWFSGRVELFIGTTLALCSELSPMYSRLGRPVIQRSPTTHELRPSSYDSRGKSYGICPIGTIMNRTPMYQHKATGPWLAQRMSTKRLGKNMNSLPNSDACQEETSSLVAFCLEFYFHRGGVC